MAVALYVPESPAHETPNVPEDARDARQAMLRGFKESCPACGRGALYSGYLKVNRCCAVCGEEFHHERSDDAAPYVTIAIVGHVVVAGLLILESAYHPALWLQFALWLPLAAIMPVLLLPRIKGALVGLQWANRMHGFGGCEIEPDGASHHDGLMPALATIPANIFKIEQE